MQTSCVHRPSRDAVDSLSGGILHQSFPSKVANFCGRVKITCFRLYKAVGSAQRAPAREGGREGERERALSVERRGEEELQLGIERVTELGRERERRHAGPLSTGWS